MESPVRQETNVSEIEHASDRQRYMPRVDIYESEEAVTVLADLPGVSKENVTLTLEQGVLTLTGRMKDPEVAGAEERYGECGPGDFHRSFRFGPQVDEAKMEAAMEDGVLRLRIPKSDWARTRKIEVK